MRTTLPEPAAAGLKPESRLQYLSGIGPRRAETFARLGLTTLEQLVRHYPRTWLDARRFVRIGELEPHQLVTVVGRVRSSAARRTRAGRSDFAALIEDGSGSLTCYFFGQPFLARTLTPGTEVVVSGELDPLERRMLNPLFEVMEGDVESLLHTGRLVPVHALTRGMTARGMRSAVRSALDAVADQLPDPLPQQISAGPGAGAGTGLLPLPEALRQI